MHGLANTEEESVLALLAGCQISLRPGLRELTPAVCQEAVGPQCCKSGPDLTRASGGLAEQAEGKEAAQVPGWAHTRGPLEQEDRVLLASHRVEEKALPGGRPRGAAAAANQGAESEGVETRAACGSLGAVRCT